MKNTKKILDDEFDKLNSLSNSHDILIVDSNFIKTIFKERTILQNIANSIHDDHELESDNARMITVKHKQKLNDFYEKKAHEQ